MFNDRTNFLVRSNLTLLYSHYTQGKKEEPVSPTDGLWFTGCTFLASHLFIIIRSLRNDRHIYSLSTRTQTKIVIILLIIITVAFATFNLFAFTSSESFTDIEEPVDFQALIVTIAYPVLDLILIVPLFTTYYLAKWYTHYVPWLFLRYPYW